MRMHAHTHTRVDKEQVIFRIMMFSKDGTATRKKTQPQTPGTSYDRIVWNDLDELSDKMAPQSFIEFIREHACFFLSFKCFFSCCLLLFHKSCLPLTLSFIFGAGFSR